MCFFSYFSMLTLYFTKYGCLSLFMPYGQVDRFFILPALGLLLHFNMQLNMYVCIYYAPSLAHNTYTYIYIHFLSKVYLYFITIIAYQINNDH